VTDQQILERDSWECQIPGCQLGPIPLLAAWPDPLSPSVDHIMPLSLGGDDVQGNKRAAHLACNVQRGNRMHPDDAIAGPEPIMRIPRLTLGEFWKLQQQGRLRFVSGLPAAGLLPGFMGIRPDTRGFAGSPSG
jgi:HNH endonuclease